MLTKLIKYPVQRQSRICYKTKEKILNEILRNLFNNRNNGAAEESYNQRTYIRTTNKISKHVLIILSFIWGNTISLITFVHFNLWPTQYATSKNTHLKSFFFIHICFTECESYKCSSLAVWSSGVCSNLLEGQCCRFRYSYKMKSPPQDIIH